MCLCGFSCPHTEKLNLTNPLIKIPLSLHPVPASVPIKRFGLIRPLLYAPGADQKQAAVKLGQAKWMVVINDEYPWLNNFFIFSQGFDRWGMAITINIVCGMKMKGQVTIPSTTIIELSNKLHSPLLVSLYLFHEIFISQRQGVISCLHLLSRLEYCWGLGWQESWLADMFLLNWSCVLQEVQFRREHGVWPLNVRQPQRAWCWSPALPLQPTSHRSQICCGATLRNAQQAAESL